MPRFALAPAVALLLAAACSSPPARSANPTRPVPERRALEIIARAARKARLTPTEGRDVSLQTGGKIHADALLEPKKWAVAYLTASDQSTAAEGSVPKKDPDHPTALVVADGSRADAGMHILVLYERDYLYDDQIGEEHEQTMITAENAIERDVTDFLVQAKARQWE